jgi:hypothetical protein
MRITRSLYTFDDCMKQQTLGSGILSKHSVEAWSGGSPVDFHYKGICYSSPEWAPDNPNVPKQMTSWGGSGVLWGIVHVPEPYDMSEQDCSDPYPPNGVGPDNLYPQIICVTYGYGGQVSVPVGGISVPINAAPSTKPVSLTPFAILMAAIIVVTTPVVYKKKRGTRKTSNQMS